MSYAIEIRNNETGEVRVSEHEGVFNPFAWDEGNYGCDCNRELFWRRAGGETPELDSVDCGDSRFDVVRVRLGSDPEWFRFVDGQVMRDVP